ncbi:MAG TPA: KH domain-containing protein [Thermoplasmata archaeon]|nr:KH domain-containing protein [Thermoplasmata archaeon]
MPVLYARIPEDRLGALIGPGGRTKRSIADATHTEVDVDPEDGGVSVSGPDTDPVAVMKARDIVLAIGRGFSPARAMRLLKDDTFLGIVDIKLATGHREKAALRRIRSRVIGSAGRARTRIEELSGCSMSVYGSTVALIGAEDELERATRAVELLVRGSEHATVFHMLSRLRRDAAVEEAMASDEPPPDGP